MRETKPNGNDQVAVTFTAREELHNKSLLVRELVY